MECQPSGDMFRGTYEHSIDEKGRINIPKPFRDLLEQDSQLFITTSFIKDINCLDVYRPKDWYRLEENLIGKPEFDPDVTDFINYFYSGVQECQLDRQGRILLAPSLRDHAKLIKDVALVGTGRKFRIIEKDTWVAVRAASGEALKSNPRIMQDLKIGAQSPED